MDNLLAEGAEYLLEEMQAYAAGLVTFKRGSDEVEVAASAGNVEFEVQNDDGLVETWSGRDFLIPVDDLLLSGSPVTPQRADQILETANGEELTYEVLAPGGSDCYSLDPSRTRFRIHTKLVDREDA